MLQVPAGTGCPKRTKPAQSTTAGGWSITSSAEVTLPGDVLTEMILLMMVHSLHKSEKINGGPIGHPETRRGLVLVLSLGNSVTCSQTLGLLSFLWIVLGSAYKVYFFHLLLSHFFLKFIFRVNKSTNIPPPHLERETRVIPVANHRAGKGAGSHGRATLPKTSWRWSRWVVTHFQMVGAKYFLNVPNKLDLEVHPGLWGVGGQKGHHR